MKMTSDDEQVILVYPPLQKEPVFVKVHEANFHEVVSKICDGYEVVYARKLHEIYESAVFICCDEFNRLDNPIPNELGTYLYNGDSLSIYDNWPILGTICIAKVIITQWGDEDIVGFTLLEAQWLYELLKQ